jgi:hypothetical protein
MATPQAITVPHVAVPRPKGPRAIVVFAAYALLGAAIVLFAAALRWTRAPVTGAGAEPPLPAPAPTCPAGMARFPGDEANRLAPFCLDVAPQAGAVDCRALGKRVATPQEREAAARANRAYPAGLRCATSL